MCTPLGTVAWHWIWSFVCTLYLPVITWNTTETDFVRILRYNRWIFKSRYHLSYEYPAHFKCMKISRWMFRNTQSKHFLSGYHSCYVYLAHLKCIKISLRYRGVHRLSNSFSREIDNINTNQLQRYSISSLNQNTLVASEPWTPIIFVDHFKNFQLFQRRKRCSCD